MKVSTVALALAMAVLGQATSAPAQELWLVTQDGVGTDRETVNVGHFGPNSAIAMSCKLRDQHVQFRVSSKAVAPLRGLIDIFVQLDHRPVQALRWPAAADSEDSFQLFDDLAKDAIKSLESADVLKIVLQADLSRSASLELNRSSEAIKIIRNQCHF